MCSGKTTVGRLLAQRRGWEFVDTDDLIVTRSGKTIETIVRDSGEVVLRRLETECFVSLEGRRETVVGGGGGAFLSHALRRLMIRGGTTVWLDVSLPAARARRTHDSTPRPLWTESADPVAFRAFFERRRATYAIAPLRIDADGPAEEVVAKLDRALRSPESNFFVDSGG
jgi:shikimate kinase